MEARVIRQKFLDFFKEKGHAVLPSAPLLPENDPTVLFTTAGMHPLVPFLMGEEHPNGTRLVNFQKCIRTGDIDEVGDESHLTFFEMLGNWSLGDYFKEDAIKWSYEFLTGEEWLNIDPKLLSVTVFGGDDDFPNLPRDDESAEIWKSVGIPEDRIAFMKGGVIKSEDNWWGPAGQTGPCGPSTEMFYWVGEGEPHGNVGENKDDWLEIWNDVLMQYSKTQDGKFEPLKQKNVDTGMGLERTATVLQGKKSIYETELFQPILEKIGTLAKKTYEEKTVSYRIIADHLRAATMLAGDGIKPSNLDQGYVMRRLIRLAIRHGKLIGIEENFTHIIAKKIIHVMSDIFPELNHEEEILATMKDEEEQFMKTLPQGLRELKKLIEKKNKEMDEGTLSRLDEQHTESEKCFNMITGKEAFYIYETYGFPVEMIEEELAKELMAYSKKEFRKEEFRAEFEEAFKKHKETSRSDAGTFKGGLQDHSMATTRLHTATHLLHSALHKVLGDHAKQRGSNITAERLRFDFSHPEKLTDEQKTAIEKYVNDAIASDQKVTMRVISKEEAKSSGAIGLFEEKYGDQVKVYDMGPWSKETCGGPHVEHLGQLSKFKIIKEKSIGAGLRRIKAILIDD